MTGMPGKQRSFSMDLSPSEAPFGGLGGGGGPGPQGMWQLPSPQSLINQSAQHPPPHDIQPQSSADGKLGMYISDHKTIHNFFNVTSPTAPPLEVTSTNGLSSFIVFLLRCR